MKRKPNVLFFFTDDQRFDTIHALGNHEIHTPNIDELTQNGTVFTHAHIPGGTVPWVCTPSRAMVHTGKTLFHLENDGESTPKEHVLLGEVFQQAGYRTFGTGKWHEVDSYARSFTDGDEIFLGGMWDHWNVPVNNFDPTGQYEKTHPFITNAWHSNRINHFRSDHMHMGKHSSELFCDAAVEWMDNYQSDDPFFMYISLMAPHDPRSMPEKFQNMYDKNKIRLPENYMDRHPFDFGVSKIRDEALAPYPRTPELVREHIAEYYGMISHLDHEFGKVVKALKRSGEYENTIIVFAGDNGLAIGQHGLFGKQNNYEHSIRVPLIFSGPGIPKNEKREAYAYLLDIFPTLCDLIGENIPNSVEGKSMAKAIQDSTITVRDSLYFAYGDSVRSVKDLRYKLIEYRTETLKQQQLFDLQNDPHEVNNLYGKADYEDIIKKLQGELFRYKEEWDDTIHPKGKKFWEQY